MSDPLQCLLDATRVYRSVISTPEPPPSVQRATRRLNEMATERKPVIKSSDMAEEMQHEAVNTAVQVGDRVAAPHSMVNSSCRRDTRRPPAAGRRLRSTPHHVQLTYSPEPQ